MKKFLIFFLFIGTLCNAQSFQNFLINQIITQNINNIADDAILYSDRYISPATDVAVYQEASGWIYSAKKQKRWSTNFGIHSNLFLVPNKNKEFELKNSELKFLKIQNASSSILPTALGNDDQVRISNKANPLLGLSANLLSIKTAQGVNQSVIFYPHLSGSICIGSGTDIIVKYAPISKLGKGNYQVYGFGLSHNLSQYFKSLEDKNFNLITVLSKSSAKIGFDFLNADAQSSISSLGIEKITGTIDTWQFQINASKEYRKFEIMGGIIANYSGFKYEVSGETGPLGLIFPLQTTLNNRLGDLSKNKLNIIAELSATYNFRKFYFQSAFAFSKFLNSNISVHYKIN